MGIQRSAVSSLRPARKIDQIFFVFIHTKFVGIGHATVALKTTPTDRFQK